MTQGKLYIKQAGQTWEIAAESGDNLLDILRANSIFIDAPCGGLGTCGKCVVDTHKGPLLACKTILDKSFFDTEITIPKAGDMKILAAYESAHRPHCNRDGAGYGIAIDIGTTTLAFELLDMTAGTRMAAHSQVNSQREYGADVMSRITNAVAGDAARLHACIKKDILDGIQHILDKGGAAASNISLVTITGNTTMLHLLLDQPCDSLGVAPFTPVFLDMKTHPFAALFDSPLLSCDVIILPGISTFVGADIAAGLLCAGWPGTPGTNLLIDLGTNGEMAVFSKDKVIVTSTAAGPAFEGGNISMGVGSVNGAIAKVRYYDKNYVYSYETIGNLPPVGICGTGVVDIAAELIRHQLVDETGRIASDDDAITIAPGILFTQKDIREIQLAKSAIRAGIEILLDMAGVGYADLSHVFIAGGFGHKIDLQSAITLGLFPTELAEKVVVLGNGALGGCTNVLLDCNAQADIVKLTAMATEVNLAAHPKFNELFMDYMDMECP
ncbi:MAG: ASKHA domain-containing protein [Defluviitaleaceae bacterium]|nr:ASKHA domain-containing protein [Defluviitaleaceae bacterium]